MQACIEKILPGNRKGGPKWYWVLGNVVIYYAISAAVLFATMQIPSSNTGKLYYFLKLWSCVGSETYRLVFFRGESVYNTTYFPWGNLVYYFWMNIMGHWFVNTSNLNFERKHIIHTRSSKYRDFLMIPLYTPILFMISSIIVLRSQNDLSSSGVEERYSQWDLFQFNLFVWTSAYFFGLQFTHFDKGPMR